MSLQSTRASMSLPPNAKRQPSVPFLGMIDSVLVDPVAGYDFDGAVNRAHAIASWTWMCRDLAPDLLGDETLTPEALNAAMPQVLDRARQAIAGSRTSVEADRRLKAQLGGGDEAFNRLPVLLAALKCRNLLDKAQSFGRATNGMHDDANLAAALQAMPLSDPPVAALLMQAAVGQVAQPSRLVAAVVRIAGSSNELAVQRAGFAPLVDALLAHAQNQIPLLRQNGAFADIDLVCRSIDRFNRLMRAVTIHLELTRLGRWATVVAALTKSVTDRVEPRLRDVMPQLNQAFRRGQNVRVDADLMLGALNGLYVLTTVRDCRDSLAVNALFDHVWAQTAQALELYLQRDLDALRADPSDAVVAERVEHAIKMAEIRFDADYAAVLRRARDAALRRHHTEH